MSRLTSYRSRGRRWRKSKPLPNSHFEFYKIQCQHCKEDVYVRVSDLRGCFGRLFECAQCHLRTRVFKRTHSFPDKCKVCDKLVACMSTPVIQVGTGTSIKKKTYGDAITNRVMIDCYGIC